MTSWADSTQATRHWPDAASLDIDRLTELLEAVTNECRRYRLGPDALPANDPTPIPADWVIATVYQAREVAAAATREGDLIGAGDLAFRSRPLTATVMQLLGPGARGGVG